VKTGRDLYIGGRAGVVVSDAALLYVKAGYTNARFVAEGGETTFDDLEAFLGSSQARVTGDVRLTLRPRAFSIDGVRSPHSMMDPAVASYGEANRLWTGDEARGFAKLYGVQQLLAKRAGGDAS
jgi:argininosuccinate synthase